MEKRLRVAFKQLSQKLMSAGGNNLTTYQFIHTHKNSLVARVGRLFCPPFTTPKVCTHQCGGHKSVAHSAATNCW
jgi:hypothetical protein